jgi:hypothetical protein
MNPVGKASNMFSSLFDRVPAKRAGNEEDIAGSVIYLISRAGVRTFSVLGCTVTFSEDTIMLTMSQAYVDGVSVCIDGGRILVANGQE